MAPGLDVASWINVSRFVEATWKTSPCSETPLSSTAPDSPHHAGTAHLRAGGTHACISWAGPRGAPAGRDRPETVGNQHHSAGLRGARRGGGPHPWPRPGLGADLGHHGRPVRASAVPPLARTCRWSWLRRAPTLPSAPSSTTTSPTKSTAWCANWDGEEPPRNNYPGDTPSARPGRPAKRGPCPSRESMVWGCSPRESRSPGRQPPTPRTAGRIPGGGGASTRSPAGPPGTGPRRGWTRRPHPARACPAPAARVHLGFGQYVTHWMGDDAFLRRLTLIFPPAAALRRRASALRTAVDRDSDHGRRPAATSPCGSPVTTSSARPS
ncbi:Acyl dehydratase OS=Streptomyces fumanus OX=67302 GN=GCM10018772_38500 PE=4 SV=1 [Streptomyces fumanus]